ncbi:MAG: ribosome biogenesis GTPase YlqF [Clostridiales bacterium]|nr:ribosome biogenesis GTPase YlqF [Clostridiales bacterium]
MNLQWYPGHMTKAKRMMQEDMKLIDVVIELVDARIPASSRNPDIDTLAAGKARILLLNKYDLADPDATERWKNWYEKKGFFVAAVNAKNGTGVRNVKDLILCACKDKIERDRKRGIKNRPIRAMIVGIPNVGKSTFINSFAGKACTKTGNKPGVTKGKQWIRLNKNVELLDTPGILWPKFEDELVGERLAFIGSIKDDIIQSAELSLKLIAFLVEHAPQGLENRYGIAQEDMENPLKILEEIALRRGCLIRGEETDYEKAAGILFDDFRSGKCGFITLELPEGEEK